MTAASPTLRYNSPAHSFSFKVQRVTAIDDDNLVVLVQEALHCRLGGPGDVAPEAGSVASPPEGVALAVLLSEDQQDLMGEQTG